MRVEPDCNGRCACSQTASHSAIAAMTGARKSFGCGLVKRIRSIRGTASTARRRSPNSVRMSGRRSRPHELTFWPRSVTSRTPSRASWVTSARISPGRRLTSRPRTLGTMQKAQTELQPIETCTHAWKARCGLRQVGGEALVGLLAHGARVEDEDIGLLLRHRFPEAERLEQALDPLGVVRVH